MNSLLALFQREYLLSRRHLFSLLQPLFFFVLIVTLFPFALGPRQLLLAQVAPGIVWVAILLSSLLSLLTLFSEDLQDGTLDQIALSDCPLAFYVAVKIISHWILSVLPMLLILPLVAFFLPMSSAEIHVLLISLIPGSLLFVFVGAFVSALTSRLLSQSLLLILLVIPLLIPVLIFGCGSIAAYHQGIPFSGSVELLFALFIAVAAIFPWLIAKTLSLEKFL